MSEVRGAVAPPRYKQSAHAEKERFHFLLRELLMQIPAHEVKGLLCGCVQDYGNPSCSFCRNLRTRTTTRHHLIQKKKQKRLRRWRGVAKAIGPIVALHRLAAEHAYAPGGAGYQEASRSFHAHQMIRMPSAGAQIAAQPESSASLLSPLTRAT